MDWPDYHPALECKGPGSPQIGETVLKYIQKLIKQLPYPNTPITTLRPHVRYTLINSAFVSCLTS